MWNSARKGIKLLMTPGPVEVSPRVLSAISQPTIYHYYEGFVDLFEETINKTSRVLHSNPANTLILQGEGVLGLEAAVSCSVNPGDRVLVFENGPFGKWFGEFVRNAGAIPVYFSEEANKCFNTSQALEFLERNNDAIAMTLVHCETPAGLLNHPKDICKKAKDLGMLTIVDCVSSLGGADFRTSEWGVDIAVGASQKCLSSPAGLTPIMVSNFAWEKIASKKVPIRNSYISLLDWKDTWLTSRTFPFTPFTSEIYALSAALDEIFEEGLENVLNRHAEISAFVRKRIQEMGLKLWPLEENFCSPTVTAISLPEGLSEARIIQDVAKKYAILIGGGYKELRGRVLRIGHMGYQAHLPFVMATMDALEAVMKSLI